MLRGFYRVLVFAMMMMITGNIMIFFGFEILLSSLGLDLCGILESGGERGVLTAVWEIG